MIRSAVAFVVVGLLAAGLLYDRVSPATDVAVAASSDTIVTPSISDPARLDGAWFCPAGSSSPDGFADHTIHISNLGDDPAIANVSILTGEGKGPTLRVELSPLSTQALALSSVVQADVAGAVIEIIGGTGVVGHQLSTEYGVAEGPCATHVSSTWLFGSGRTQRDSKEYLALMNPFPEAAVYNIELYRAAGRPRLPADLQGGIVPANSVQIVEIDEYVAREEAVAASISTVRGRLVAERLQTLDGELGPTGAALQLGVTAPATSWMLPAGRIHGGGDDRVIVFNPSATETANVEVDLWPLNPTDRSLYGLGPIPRELLPQRFEVIDLRIEADRFGLLLPFEVGVSVTSANAVPVVAERWHFATEVDTSLIGAGGTEVAPADDEEPAADGEEPAADGEEPAADGEEPAADGEEPAADGEEPAADGEEPAADGEETTDTTAEAGELDVPGILGGEAAELGQPTATLGVATTRGTEVVSTRWIVPWVSTPGPDSSVAVVTSLQEASVEMFVLVNGELQGPVRASIAPGGRAILPIEAGAQGAPILVIADAPVSVEAQVVRPGASLAIVPGVPTLTR